MYIDFFEPVGSASIRCIEIRASSDGITHVLLADQPPAGIRSSELIERCKRQLAEYFQGARRTFDLPLAPGGTPFQQRVWLALRELGYGATCSYGALAAHLGCPGSQRAVGAANGRNPIAIIVPCHRVIGASGKLTGYAGGLDRKAWLLQHESAQLTMGMDSGSITPAA